MSVEITPVTLDQLSRLGIDQFNHLYWDGAQVQTVLSLPYWLNIAVGLGAAATVLNFVWNVFWALYRARLEHTGEARSGIIALKKRANISPEVRAELEQRGPDSVRALLVTSMGDNDTGRDAYVMLSSGKKLPRGDIEDWLQEKKAADDCWIKTAAIAAIVAAIIALLAWVYPIK